MTPLADLDSFVRDHQPHGALTGDADPPSATDYRLWVACPCGVRFERFVTPEDATVDLAGWAKWS